VLLDTDASALSGLKLPGKAPENGADLAIIVQGAREYSRDNGEGFLRVKVRRLADGSHSVDDGELISELEHRLDPERIHLEGNTVFLLIDATSNLPSGRKVRVVYHPPGGKAIEATIPGMLSGSASNGKVMIFRRGGWGKAREGGQRISGETK
jgi:hypothetical protein